MPLAAAWSESFLPEWAHEVRLGALELWQMFGVVLCIAVSIVLARLTQYLVLKAGRRIAKATATVWDDSVLELLEGPLWLLLTALLTRAAIGLLHLDAPVERAFDILVNSVAIASLVWLANRVLKLLITVLAIKAGRPDGEGRSLRTHVELTGRFAQIAVWLIGSSVFLLQFEVVRSVGVSLLASAGIAGVVLGFAAQRSIAQLFAGIQLSITQPLRIGDLVVINEQFGEVEEVRLTYVVIRTWDSRRLMVPISQLLEKPFENWSLGSLDVVASFTVDLDYGVNVDEVRAALDQALTTEPAKTLWDGRSKSVQVTNLDARGMTLRLAASVSDAAKAFSLTCALRERLAAWLASRPLAAVRGRGEAITVPPPPAPAAKTP